MDLVRETWADAMERIILGPIFPGRYKHLAAIPYWEVRDSDDD